MKSKNIKLDVDLIGDQRGLTLQEEKALSEYFAKKKQSAQRRSKTKTVRRTKSTA